MTQHTNPRLPRRLGHALRGLVLVTAAAILWPAGGSPLEASSLRKIKRVGKKTAPDQHDHARYFSSKRKPISDEAKAKADQLRLDTIKSINELLKSAINDFQKFELYLRLGELHAERHDYLRDVEITQYDKRYKHWERKGKKGPEPKLTFARSKRELLNSARSFRKLVRTYPKHPRADAALYSLAKTLGRLKNDSASLYFKQLIRSHPNSTLIAQAHLALGEYYFDSDKVTEALKSYKAAMKYKQSKVYPYAVYKLGWAYYNSPARSEQESQKNIRKALSAFKLVVKLSEQSEGKSHGMNLKAEAIKDLVLVWAETEGVDEAFGYFSKKGMNKEFYDVLENLGYIYTDQGKNQKAIQVYTRLLREAPLRAKNYDIYVKLVQLHDKIHRVDLVIQNLSQMNQTFVGMSSWKKANKDDSESVELALEKTELYTRRYATIYHKKAQKTKKKVYLEAAKNAYALYLKSFPDNENAYSLRYYYADVLYDFEQFERASIEYIRVAKQKPKDGDFLKDAALNAVYSINNIDQKTKYPKVPPAGQLEKPLPLPRIKKILVEAMDLYVKLLPKEKKGYMMRYIAAETLLTYGYYGKSLERFDKIIYEIPKTKEANESLRIRLDFYRQKKDWSALVKTTRKYLEFKPILSKKNKKLIMDNLKGATYQLAGQQERDNKFETAAESYLAFQREFPRDPSSDRALYNGMLIYFKLAKTERALATGSVLIKEYPKSKLVPGVLANIAQTYEALADFPKAAASYRQFNFKFPFDKRAAGALFNAAILYKGLKQYPDSMKMLKRFVKVYPKHALVSECTYEMAVIEERQKNYKAAFGHYQAFGRKVAKSEPERSYMALAKAAALEHQFLSKSYGFRKLRSLRAKLLKKNAPPAFEARRIVAGQLFKRLDSKLVRYKRTKIDNPKKIQKQVVAKQQQLLALAKDYQDIIAIGSGEFVVGSLYRLGQLHEEFANALFKVPSPPGLDQEGVDQFRTSIEKVAFPLKEESRTFYETSYKRSKEVQTFTKWTKMTYDKMVELAPNKFAKMDEKHHDSSYLSHKLIWDDTLLSLSK